MDTIMDILDDCASALLITFSSSTIQGRLAEVLTAIGTGDVNEVLSKLNRIITLIEG